MTRKFVGWLGALGALGAAVVALAQPSDPKAAEASLRLDEKKYSLKQATAYETILADDEVIAVVFTNQAITREKLTAARESEKEGGSGDFKTPYLKLIFTRTGELRHVAASGGGTTISHGAEGVVGELKVQDGRAVGKASKALDPQAMFATSFEVSFNVPLLKAGESLPESTAKKGGPAANITPTVSGVFKGNGKEAKLAHVSARWVEPFNDKASIELVFTEKDHAKDKKPGNGALFGRFGSALIVSLHAEDGGIFGCQVVHSAHQKQGFSSIGRLEATSFTYGDGKVEGELSTHGETDTFGETWEVNLKFAAPLGEIAKEFQPTAPKEEGKPPKTDDKSATLSDDAEKNDSASAPEPKAKALPLTKDATDVQYKDVVEQIEFKSKTEVKKVCAELAAALKAQGWTVDGRDLVQPASSILRRKRGDAELTIFVKPENGGSEIKIMTEGLAWDED